MERHPEKCDELEKYFNYRKSQTQGAEKLAQYEQAEDDFGLNASTIVAQEDLETQDGDFLHYIKALEEASSIIDSDQ